MTGASRADRRAASRRRDGRVLSRAHAFAVLGLAGSGALRVVHLNGVVRIRRGGVWLCAAIVDVTPRRFRTSP